MGIHNTPWKNLMTKKSQLANETSQNPYFWKMKKEPYSVPALVHCQAFIVNMYLQVHKRITEFNKSEQRKQKIYSPEQNLPAMLKHYQLDKQKHKN